MGGRIELLQSIFDIEATRSCVVISQTQTPQVTLEGERGMVGRGEWGGKGGGGGEEGTHCREVRRKKFGTLHEFACHPCAGAMLIFSVSFQF